MNEEERRYYERISFVADVIIEIDDLRSNCELVDLSVKGVLIKAPADIEPQLNSTYKMTLLLGKDAKINMQARISHTNNNNWGLKWENIDIESFTHLRKLLELSTQDPDMVHRELSKLGKDAPF